MKLTFVILFLLTLKTCNAQEYAFDFIITYQHPDSINLETDKKDFDAFIELSEPSYAPLFHLKGTTLPTPFSPVYEWDLFVGNREFIEINVSNEIGQNMVKTFQDTLNPGIYNIKLDGLWDVEKPTYYLVEVKSRNKTSILKSFFWGLDNLLPPEDGLTIKAIPSNGILNDSLSITSTIAKNKPHHLTGWILNLPKRRPHFNYIIYQIVHGIIMKHFI